MVFPVFSQMIMVTDEETGQPLERVQIVGKESGRYTLTNEDGEADISAFKGEKEIEFSVPGYEKEWSLLRYWGNRILKLIYC